jgi:putative Holliday junction resolvase
MSEQKRLLGIDYGERRVGLALSDEMGIIAQPYLTFPNDKTVIQRLKELVIEHHIKIIVIGIPYNLKGERSKKALEVEQFIAKLEKTEIVKIIQWDERFTSTLANKAIIEMGTKKKQRRTEKRKVDAIAAALILQSYLDSQRKINSI